MIKNLDVTAKGKNLKKPRSKRRYCRSSYKLDPDAVSYTCHLNLHLSLFCIWLWILFLRKNSDNSQQSHHWILPSPFNREVKIFGSLFTHLTIEILQEIKQLFSPGNALPQYQVSACYKQVATTDCGVLAIVYSFGNYLSEMVYEQSKLRQHFVDCWQKRNIGNIPKAKMQREIPWYKYNQIHYIWRPTQMGNTLPLSTPFWKARRFENTIPNNKQIISNNK